jgi:hypothetical protein
MPPADGQQAQPANCHQQQAGTGGMIEDIIEKRKSAACFWFLIIGIILSLSPGFSLLGSR